MVINLIVIAVTLLMIGFVGVWLLYPRCRPWIEAPKWQPLAWDKPAPVSQGHARSGRKAFAEGDQQSGRPFQTDLSRE